MAKPNRIKVFWKHLARLSAFIDSLQGQTLPKGIWPESKYIHNLFRETTTEHSSHLPFKPASFLSWWENLVLNVLELVSRPTSHIHHLLKGEHRILLKEEMYFRAKQKLKLKKVKLPMWSMMLKQKMQACKKWWWVLGKRLTSVRYKLFLWVNHKLRDDGDAYKTFLKQWWSNKTKRKRREEKNENLQMECLLLLHSYCNNAVDRMA